MKKIFLQSVTRYDHSNGYTKALLVSTLLCFSVITSSNAFAKGVTAGTNISNIASVSYSTNNTPQTLIESSPTGNSTSGIGKGQSTDFIVDRKIDLLVTGNNNANVNPGDTQAEVTFSLQNQGNATQEFSLNANNLLTSDDFDIESCNLQVTGVTGTPIAGVVLPTAGNILLSADQQATVSVTCDIPYSDAGSPILSGQTALLELLATVEKNEDGSDTVASNSIEKPHELDTVFADGAGTADIIQDASHSATRTYIASSSTAPPELTMDKTIVSVVDPAGGDKAISGSEVTYKIQVNSTGIGTIENLVISDKTPSEMTYKLNSIQLNSTNQTDISDVADNTDFGISTTDTATINLGSFSAGNQYEILLTYIVN